MIRLAIVGSRDRHTEMEKERIRYHILQLNPDELVSGGCEIGADHFAEMLSAETGIPIQIFLPQYPWLTAEKRCQWCTKWKGIYCEVCVFDGKYYEAVKALYARNRKIVDYATHMIALPRGNCEGGAGYTVKYWRKLKGDHNLTVL